MPRWLPAVLVAGWLTVPALAADPPPKSYQLPYRLTDTKHVLVRTKLNGKGPYHFILDTGAPAVFIPKKVAREVGLQLDDKGWGTFDKFEIEGGLTVPEARARVEDLFQLEGMNGLGLAGVELHGVIGYNVLAKYRITYDFSADKLLWEPLPGFEPPPIRRIGSGGQGGLEILGPLMKVLAGFMGITPNFEVRPRGFLGIETEEKDGAVLVKAVLPESPAAKAGLKPGDRLAAVRIAQGSRKARRHEIDSPRDLDRALAEARAGDEARIEVRRGDQSETVVVPLGKGL